MKLAEKRQLSLLESGGHHVTKELECESNHSVVHLDLYVSYLRKKGPGFDRRALAKALKAKRSLVVLIKNKERRVFGPVQLSFQIDFVKVVRTAWILRDEDMADQIFVGRNELSLRAIGQATGARSARIDGDPTMSAHVRVPGGRVVKLHGMLDTGAGVSVMSTEAWRELGAPFLKPWEVPIRMANDQPFEVLGITGEMYLKIAGLDLVALIVVESLGENDFLLGWTFIRDFDGLTDLSKN